jgi:predicted transcriptional regulator
VAERPQPVSEAELEVLKALWERGPGTVRELRESLGRQGRDWAYTTVQTLLQRLEAKGHVRSEKGPPAHVYRAAVTRERLLGQRLRDLADQLCGGAAEPLLLALVEEGRFPPEEIRRLRRLLDELEAPAKKPPRGK